MKPETIPGFDGLEFKWKVQSEIYEKTKSMNVEEQIAYFRNAAETGPFVELIARMPRTMQNREPGLPPARSIEP